MEEMNTVQRNISHVISHTQGKNPGHDPFTLSYSQMISLEMMGVESSKAYENRGKVIQSRNAVDLKLNTLDSNRQMQHQVYQESSRTLKKLEERYRVGRVTSHSGQAALDKKWSSHFVDDNIMPS